MNIQDIPGYAEAVAALQAGGYDHYVAGEVTHVVLKAATPVILAAALADISDAIETEVPEWLDGPMVAAYLDAMSARIRERTGL